MSEANKNITGINTFLVSNKLFSKDGGNFGRKSFLDSSQSHINSESGSRSANKYKYNLLNDVKREVQRQQTPQEKTYEPAYEEHTKRKQHTSKQSSKYNLRENSPIKNQTGISRISHVHKPTINQQPLLETWESQVVRSSRKYFDSCRGEAHDYILKMEAILGNDNGFVHKAIQEIRDFVYDSHHQVAEKMKEDLYLAVDEAVERWKAEEIRKSQSKEIEYLGELLELSTQIEERTKQMTQYKLQLDDEKNWKQRASDLLTSSYEEDIFDLSKQCKKSVTFAKQNTQKVLNLQHTLLEHKITEIGKENISLQIKTQIIDRILNKKESQKPSQRGKETFNKKFQFTKQQLQKLQHGESSHRPYYRKQIFHQNRKNSSRQSICEGCQERYHTPRSKDSK